MSLYVNDSSRPALVLVLGKTGVGKSTFIKAATGLDVEIGHNLNSCTPEVQIYPVKDSSTFLIDTPGFNDPARSDINILQSIASCLADMHEGLTFVDKEVNLSGIIYIHPINDGRMDGTTMKNLRMLQHLVGQDNMKHCVFVTSKWGLEGASKARERERELITDEMFWNKPLSAGASMRRYEDSSSSALDIINLSMREGIFVPELIREYVIEGKELYQTSAGNAIDQDIAKARERHETQRREFKTEQRRALETHKANNVAHFRSQLLEMEASLRIKEDGMDEFRMTRGEAQQRLDELELIASGPGKIDDMTRRKAKYAARQKRAFRWLGRSVAMGAAVTMTILTQGALLPVAVTLVAAVETVCQAQKDRDAKRQDEE